MERKREWLSKQQLNNESESKIAGFRFLPEGARDGRLGCPQTGNHRPGELDSSAGDGSARPHRRDELRRQAGAAGRRSQRIDRGRRASTADSAEASALAIGPLCFYFT